MKTIVSLLFISLLFLSCTTSPTPLIGEGAKLKLVADGFEFTEGPAANVDGDVFFTDQPNDRIVKWSATDNTVVDYMKPSGRSNGLYFDQQGNLISCADEKNELWKIDKDKNVTVLVSNFNGKKLGGPNDLWVHPNGDIYFTDPYYERPWWNHGEEQISQRRVYLLSSKDQKVQIAAEDFIMPNGIIGTPDGKKIYIADIKGKKTYVFDISTDGALTHRKLFCNLGSDGMTIDERGNLYLTGDGVTVFNPKGEQIEHIAVPKNWTANVTFGGREKTLLFITALDAVYTLQMNVTGV